MSDAMKGGLVMRLRGQYPVGPEVNGEPEFGYRQFDPVRPIQNEAADVIESQAKQIAELEAKAICYVSHNIKWLGEKGAPGWCLGCGKHRSLIRESSEEQQS